LPALGQITVTASADPSIGQAPLTVQLSASASIFGFPPTDPTWSWNFGDGTSGTGQTVHHTYLEPGTYRAVVFMTDWPPFPSDSPEARRFHWIDPHTGTGGVTITVLPDFFFATPTATPSTGPTPLTVKFNVTISGGGFSRFTYLWDFGDSSETSTEAAPTHTYSFPGAYAAKVTVTDSKGFVSGGSITIFADFTGLSVTTTATPNSGYAPLGVGFSASASGGVAPYTYSWNFGDGTSGTGSSVSHTYANPGTYTAMVMVIDSTGRSTSMPAAAVTAYPKMVGPPMP